MLRCGAPIGLEVAGSSTPYEPSSASGIAQRVILTAWKSCSIVRGRVGNFQDRKQVGRNDPCPCGSGRKFKRCHGSSAAIPFSFDEKRLPDKIVKQLEQFRAAELQRQQQQGLGEPIVSAEVNGWRFVAVKGQLFAGKWRTFHDFLYHYIKNVLGSDWGNAELAKPEDERHPVLNWYQTAAHYQNQFITERGKVHFAPMTGAVAAHLGLAYNLYVLAHNADIQELLIKRLKGKTQFYGAYYETYVAARLILAGFDLEFEDETDSTTSHCELTATCRNTGKKFSVEAKMRGLGKASADVRDQLYRALKKMLATLGSYSSKQTLRTRAIRLTLSQLCGKYWQASAPARRNSRSTQSPRRQRMLSLRTTRISTICMAKSKLGPLPKDLRSAISRWSRR